MQVVGANFQGIPRWLQCIPRYSCLDSLLTPMTSSCCNAATPSTSSGLAWVASSLLPSEAPAWHCCLTGSIFRLFFQSLTCFFSILTQRAPRRMPCFLQRFLTFLPSAVRWTLLMSLLGPKACLEADWLPRRQVESSLLSLYTYFWVYPKNGLHTAVAIIPCIMLILGNKITNLGLHNFRKCVQPVWWFGAGEELDEPEELVASSSVEEFMG